MTVVIGTAGHIDHGKTTLLRALTGIDADRLPEERRRGMTIDVGYAHLALPDGTELDFVDVPGHDRLVGNMLVGAGEVDAALVVVAADDGLRAQTHEHLDLLDALAVRHAVVAVTKVDLVDRARAGAVAADVAARLEPTTLAGAAVVLASATSGDGIDDLRAALVDLRDRVLADPRHAADAARPPRLAVDRAFRIRGRGLVVTGTLRGGTLERGATLLVVPGGEQVRVRELQVHGTPVDRVAGGGRTALNLAGSGTDGLRRGVTLTADPAVEASDRLLVRLTAGVADRSRFRLHLVTSATEVSVGRSGRDAVDLPNGTAALLRLEEPVAVAVGDRFALRRGSGSPPVVGGVVLDPRPPRGISRRRQTGERVAALAAAVDAGDPASVERATIDLHGVLVPDLGTAPDVRDLARAIALEFVTAHHAGVPDEPGAPLDAVRAAAARSVRRNATLDQAAARTVATRQVDGLVDAGQLVRDGDRLRLPSHRVASVDERTLAAMDRLEAALSVVAPPPLRQAALDAECPPDGVRELERVGRIVVLDEELAYAMSTYRDLAAKALTLARRAPLAPAAFRDATGTSRRYVMPILEDLDRREILRRTPEGHVPGPRAPVATQGTR